MQAGLDFLIHLGKWCVVVLVNIVEMHTCFKEPHIDIVHVCSNMHYKANRFWPCSKLQHYTCHSKNLPHVDWLASTHLTVSFFGNSNMQKVTQMTPHWKYLTSECWLHQVTQWTLTMRHAMCHQAQTHVRHFQIRTNTVTWWEHASIELEKL